MNFKHIRNLFLLFLKEFKTTFAFTLVLSFISCTDKSVEPEVLYNYTQRVSNSFILPATVTVINVSNPIGVVSVSGSADTATISYVLDKTVKVTGIFQSQDAFDQIYLNQYPVADTSISTIVYPAGNGDNYKCNYSLSVPDNKKIILKSNMGGIYVSHVSSEVYAETSNYDCLVTSQYGSFEAHTSAGGIAGSIMIPQNGFCKCYSTSGNIFIQIPKSTSAALEIKTGSGTISYKNLNVNIEKSTSTELKGTLGNSEGTIYLETTSGNITVEGI